MENKNYKNQIKILLKIYHEKIGGKKLNKTWKNVQKNPFNLCNENQLGFMYLKP